MLEKRKKEISHNLKIQSNLKIQPNLKNSNFIQLIENQRWIFSNSLIYIYIYKVRRDKKQKEIKRC